MTWEATVTSEDFGTHDMFEGSTCNVDVGK